MTTTESNSTTKTTTVKRTDGTRQPVEVADAQHYEVCIWNEAEAYSRTILVIADTATEAKRLARTALTEGEAIDLAAKTDLATVAIFALHGSTPIR
jgi:hypothetical protein